MTNTTHPTKFAQQVARGMTLAEIAKFYSSSAYDGEALGKACEALADRLYPCDENMLKHQRLMAVVEELVVAQDATRQDEQIGVMRHTPGCEAPIGIVERGGEDEMMMGHYETGTPAHLYGTDYQ